MRRIRFTVRRMMVAVAIAGLMLWGEKIRRQWVKYRSEAADYARLERLCLDGASRYDLIVSKRRAMEDDWGVAHYGQRAEKDRVDAEDCSRLRRKCERAARYPRLPVAPEMSGP